VALELHVITSYEFIRLGTHGELDWGESLKVLSAIMRGFLERSVDLAILDLRDARIELTGEQLEALVTVLQGAGFREHHKVAILHRHLTGPRAGTFVNAAQDLGFDFEAFDSYERAVEWLSAPPGKDPDFEREVYLGPKDKKNPDPRPRPNDPS